MLESKNEIIRNAGAPYTHCRPLGAGVRRQPYRLVKMGLGYQKSRRHAASDRRVMERLALHAAWMKYFEDRGFDKRDASAEALKRVLAGEQLPT